MMENFRRAADVAPFVPVQLCGFLFLFAHLKFVILEELRAKLWGYVLGRWPHTAERT